MEGRKQGHSGSPSGLYCHQHGGKTSPGDWIVKDNEEKGSWAHGSTCWNSEMCFHRVDVDCGFNQREASKLAADPSENMAESGRQCETNQETLKHP